MKKTASLAMAAALLGTALLPAHAATPVRMSAPSRYTSTILLNGEKLDTTGIPGADAGMIPLRLVAESDHGGASWFREENSSGFYFDGGTFMVNFTTDTIQLEDTTVSGTVELAQGVTFVPATVLEELEGYDVTVKGSIITITTPNNAPIAKAAYAIAEAAEVPVGSKASMEVLTSLYGLPEDTLEEAVSFLTMITSPDTVFVGKLKKGADKKAVEKAFEAYRQLQEDTFSWYLSHNLPKVQDARMVFEGDYFLFLISGKADEGVAEFRTFAKENS